MRNNTSTNIKIFSPTAHGVVDYLVIVGLVIVPSLIDPVSGWFAAALYLLAAVHLGVTLATRFAAGMFDGLSFRSHGLLELLLAILLTVSPWLFGFANMTAVRNTYVAIGVLLFVVWLLTEYRPAPKQSAHSSSTKKNDTKQEKSGENNEQKK